MQHTAQFSKSKIPCLVRHRGGNYYASVKVSGKLIRRTLETDDYNIAKNRLPAMLATLRGAANAAAAHSLGDSIDREAHREDPALKETTRHYYRQLAGQLARVASNLPDNPLSRSITRITLADLRTLMDAFGGASSPTRYNGALALIRRTYARAVESGHVAADPSGPLKRRKPLKRKHDLPEVGKFAAILDSIRAQGKSHSLATAAAVEFLAFSGMRISEARSIQWRDIKADHIIVRTVKGDDLRQIPIIPAMRDALERLSVSGVPTGPNDPVMLIVSPRIALASACRRLKIDHLRVHDLRHIFATRCIESGVDIPTVSHWLGHKDGGVLAMQIYGHLSHKHSTAMAGKVIA